MFYKKYLNMLLFAGVVFLFSISSLLAGPFLKIHTVDVESSYPNIQIRVSAQDRYKNWIGDLTEDNITVYEDGYRVNYVQVSNQQEEKDLLYLVFSLDASKSITEKTFAHIKNIALKIVGASSSDERIALFRFNDKVMFLNNFTENKGELINSIQGIERGGSKTLLYDALYDGIDFVTRTEQSRKAVIIFTDGKDEGSSVTFDDVVSFANEKGVPLFIISIKGSKNLTTLQRMAKLTGGQTLVIDKINDIPYMYNHIIRNIKTQYLIKYVTMAPQDGKNHLMEVRLKYNEIRDRDTRNFSVHKNFFNIAFPTLYQIILVFITFMLVICFFFLLFFLIKRRKKEAAKKKHKSKFIEKKKVVKSKKGEKEPFYHDEQVVGGNKKEETDSDIEAEIGDLDRGSGRSYGEAWLILQDSKGNRKFSLHKDEVVIGSGNDAHIVIKNKKVSHHHSCIKKIEKDYFLFDMVSEEGTFLNNKKLLRPKQLFDWDEIKIGPLRFIFRGSKI
jgi:VWFA-related protein